MSTASTTLQTNPVDSTIERNRFGRFLSTVSSPVISVLLGRAVGIWAMDALYFPTWWGSLIGIAAGATLGAYLVKKSIIFNEAVQAFVTENPLVSLLKLGNALVSYGPGMHFCYWWEKRSANNNISLKAGTDPIQGTAVVKDGTLNWSGSGHLRPDIHRLPQFLSGVAGATGELTSLIQKEINAWLSGKTVDQALAMIGELNAHLKAIFVDADHPIEVRYGVKIDDITIGEVLPSKEVQETKGTILEMATIDQIVATSFGYASAKTLQNAVKKGTVQAEEVNRRRTQAMAASGNLQGMDLRSHDFNLNISGLKDMPPDLVRAFGAFAKTFSDVKNPAATTTKKG